MSKLQTLNQEQAQAVIHTEGPLLVLAGAGTGKTRVIAERIAHLIQTSAAASKILAITFTEKTATEMSDRVNELLNTYNFDVNITTFNAFGDDIIRRFAYELGLTPQLTLMSDTQQLIFLREHFDAFALDYYAPITNPEGMLSELGKYFSQLKNNLITPEEYQQWLDDQTDDLEPLEKKRHQELATAYATYTSLCRRANTIDFDDQIYLCVELLKKRPNIRKLLRGEFAYTLVDEYQDTNRAQNKLIELLAGRNGNVTVVGDDDQCIYNFRGAAVANILAFREQFDRAKQVTLLQNYRSSQEILDTAYTFIQHNNPGRLEAKYDINKQLRAQFQGPQPQVKDFITREEEARWIAEDIKRRLQKGVDPAEIAVLTRKNNQTKVIERYLAAADIDYVIIGEKDNLYRQLEVKILLWFLHALVDPSDSESLYHLLTSSIYGVDPTWLRARVGQARRQHQPLENILRGTLQNDSDIPESVHAALEKLFAQLQQWRAQLSEVSVGRICYMFLEDTGFLKQLLEEAASNPAADVKIATLNQFFTSLVEFERIAQDNSAVAYVASLPALMTQGEQLQLEDMPDVYGQKVRVMTVHQAKGLEFDSVYLFDVTQGGFPTRRMASSLQVPPSLLGLADRQQQDTHIEEERRLLYVAMTRAKRTLVLTYSYDHGGKRAKKPSQFLAEAFGEQALPSTQRQPKANAAQIELFKTNTQPQVAMPDRLLDGDTLQLSVRQIEDYLMCPAEFYFKHVLKPPLPASFALEYGVLIHDVIQQYNRRKRDGLSVSLKQLLRHLEEGWPKEGFLTPGHEQKSIQQARDTVRTFYKREERQTRHPRYIEQAFTLALPDIKAEVNGRFDAVYDDKTGVEIRDYKTGGASITSQEKADTKTKNSLQLTVYALAWQQLRGVVPDQVVLDFVDSGYIGLASKTARQLRNAEQKIEAVARGIRDRDFAPASSHLFCTHKEYDL